MIRTEVELTEEQYQRIEQLAAAGRLSVEEQITLVLSAYLSSSPPTRRRCIADIAGAFRPTQNTLTADHDQRIVDAILASKGRD